METIYHWLTELSLGNRFAFAVVTVLTTAAAGAFMALVIEILLRLFSAAAAKTEA